MPWCFRFAVTTRRVALPFFSYPLFSKNWPWFIIWGNGFSGRASLLIGRKRTDDQSGATYVHWIGRVGRLMPGWRLAIETLVVDCFGLDPVQAADPATGGHRRRRWRRRRRRRRRPHGEHPLGGQQHQRAAQPAVAGDPAPPAAETQAAPNRYQHQDPQQRRQAPSQASRRRQRRARPPLLVSLPCHYSSLGWVPILFYERFFGSLPGFTELDVTLDGTRLGWVGSVGWMTGELLTDGFFFMFSLLFFWVV